MIWILIGFLSFPSAAQHETPDPLAVLDRVDDLMRGVSSSGIMEMEIQTRHWKRSLSIQFWSKGKDKSLLKILSPKKERGTSTLRSGGGIWNYLPKVNRTIKLPSGMLSSSWMGSHFTNDDLLKDSRMAEDYRVEISFEGERQGREILEITCFAKPDSVLIWGKVIVCVTRADYIPISIEYFDEDFSSIRLMSFFDFTNQGGRTIPLRIEMIPTIKAGEYTVLTYKRIEFDLELSDDIFSLRGLQNRTL